ncbi:thermonuclease family protein [Treponema pedis]|uniref:thermonuclease family protein n=1 Tax=Treponema pedis TaxID=409322 RepID=UPI0004206647|nr:thermonuclease family protein [Treponema pedis]
MKQTKFKLSLIIITVFLIGCKIYSIEKQLVYFSCIKKQELDNLNIKKLFKAEVIKVVDGDTVKVKMLDYNRKFNKVETIRFIGVDTPETVHPKKSVQYFGKEASEYTKRELNGKIVYLGFDNNLRDKYNRLLCYCYTEDGLFINYRIIYNGYGYAYIKYPFVYAKKFKKAEKEARKSERGLWAPLK